MLLWVKILLHIYYKKLSYCRDSARLRWLRP